MDRRTSPQAPDSIADFARARRGTGGAGGAMNLRMWALIEAYCQVLAGETPPAGPCVPYARTCDSSRISA